jgi:hypothetical protein
MSFAQSCYRIETSHLLKCCMMELCSVSSALEMEAICSSETEADFQLTTLCYVPHYSTLHVFS